MNHQEARRVIVEAFKRTEPRIYPSLSALQYFQALGVIESGYGSGKATNNWGSVQCNHPAPAREGECVILQDSQADGTKFTYPYRVYATPEDGAFGMISLIQRKWPKTVDAADMGRTLEASTNLYGYYTGVNNAKLGIRTQADRIGVHARAVYDAAGRIAKALGEPLKLDDPSHALHEIKAGSLVAVVAIMGLAVLIGRR